MFILYGRWTVAKERSEKGYQSLVWNVWPFCTDQLLIFFFFWPYGNSNLVLFYCEAIPSRYRFTSTLSEPSCNVLYWTSNSGNNNGQNSHRHTLRGVKTRGHSLSLLVIVFLFLLSWSSLSVSNAILHSLSSL